MRLLWLLPTLSALRFSPRKIAKPAGRLSAKVARAPWRIATQPWKVQDKFNASPSAASELYKPNAPEDDEPLTRSQFRVALDRLGIKTSPKDLRDLWRMLDADKNEAIFFSEKEANVMPA